LGRYNFHSIRKTLRVAAAMVAGVTDRIWDMSDIAALIAAQQAPVAKGARQKADGAEDR
jgi:hypothetical protein